MNESDLETMASEDFDVIEQWTPNPNAFKFITDNDLISSGKANFKQTDEDLPDVPLVHALLSLEGVEQIHFFENTVTVTQTGDKNWSELSRSVKNAMIQMLAHHDPSRLVSLDAGIKKRKILEDPELQKIDKILDEYIRPGLQSDGGDVEVVSLEDKILTIRYEGACGSCPSSLSGTLQAIRHYIRDEYDDTIEVITV